MSKLSKNIVCWHTYHRNIKAATKDDHSSRLPSISEFVYSIFLPPNEKKKVVPHCKEGVSCKSMGYSKIFVNNCNDLYRITKKFYKYLIDYHRKFGREALNILHLEVVTVVEAYKTGLEIESQFYEDLVITTCMKVNEVRNMALRFIRLEEDKLMQKKIWDIFPKILRTNALQETKEAHSQCTRSRRRWLRIS